MILSWVSLSASQALSRPPMSSSPASSRACVTATAAALLPSRASACWMVIISGSKGKWSTASRMSSLMACWPTAMTLPVVRTDSRSRSFRAAISLLTRWASCAARIFSSLARSCSYRLARAAATLAASSTVILILAVLAVWGPPRRPRYRPSVAVAWKTSTSPSR